MQSSGTTALQPAYILHRSPYANSSLLLECFTAAAGRFPAIARGGRTAGTRQPTAPQPFTPLLLAWRGTGEVKTVTVCEPAGVAPRLAGAALYCGFYLNELLMRLLGRGDPHGPLFQHYAEALRQLAAGDQLDTCLRRFELLLLHELGYGLMLEREAETGAPVEPARRYHYRPETGPVPAQAPGCGVHGATLLALAADRPLAGEAVREARALMRQVLSHYLGGRPLKSRELFRSLGTADTSTRPLAATEHNNNEYLP